MKDFMFVPAKNQASVKPWYKRKAQMLANLLCLLSSAFMLVLMAFLVGLR